MLSTAGRVQEICASGDDGRLARYITDMAKLPDALRRAREKWANRGQTRPPFAVEPGPGQESVWDYPRPPRLVRDARIVEVRAGEILVARTRAAWRVLETASPPTFYLPPEDIHARLEPARGGSFCEWKGQAAYWSVVAGDAVLENVAWSYPHPLEGFEAVAGYVSFYPGKIPCFVDGIRVTPQPGGFYGGWITPEIVGPFKGDPGTSGW